MTHPINLLENFIHSGGVGWVIHLGRKEFPSFSLLGVKNFTTAQATQLCTTNVPSTTTQSKQLPKLNSFAPRTQYLTPKLFISPIIDYITLQIVLLPDHWVKELQVKEFILKRPLLKG